MSANLFALEGAFMCLQPMAFPPIPEDTARLAHAIFARRGNLYLTIADRVGPLFADVDFAPLYAADGKPAVSPNLLALVLIFQALEDLSDRAAADAVRSRIDWKYALHLPLADTGFDHTLLSDFRDRLAQSVMAQQMFDQVLRRLREMGLVHAGGRQRTDSSYVLAATRSLSRVELVAETIRLALEALAAYRPEWLRSVAQPHWYERYRQLWTAFRLPRSREQREALGLAMAADGSYLLAVVSQPEAPSQAAHLPEVVTLRRVWEQQFVWQEGQAAWRPVAQKPAGAERIVTPHDVEVRPGCHGEHEWEGYALHWTESCDANQVHLITDVEAVPAPTADINQLPAIQQRLAQRDLLPTEHLVDAGYVAGHTLVESTQKHGIALIGPIEDENSWQARHPQGITTDQFVIDWVQQQARCPQGQLSSGWSLHQDKGRHPVVEIYFPKAVCQACPIRERCTRATTHGRGLQLNIYHDAILAARQRQETAAFRRAYAARAGMEGTISEAANSHGARRTRYGGLVKSRVQALLTAMAINLKRTALWLMAATPPAPPRSRDGRLSCLASPQLMA